MYKHRIDSLVGGNSLQWRRPVKKKLALRYRQIECHFYIIASILVSQWICIAVTSLTEEFQFSSDVKITWPSQHICMV